MRPRRQGPPGTGAGQLVRAKLGQRGEQRRGFRQHHLGEGLEQRGQRGALRPVGAFALERALPTRVDRGQQTAHVGEEVQRLATGEPLVDISQQIARACLVRTCRTHLPPVLVLSGLPPALMWAPSALGHRRQPIGATRGRAVWPVTVY